jgi:hypothetical protein
MRPRDNAQAILFVFSKLKKKGVGRYYTTTPFKEFRND